MLWGFRKGEGGVVQRLGKSSVEGEAEATISEFQEDQRLAGCSRRAPPPCPALIFALRATLERAAPFDPAAAPQTALHAGDRHGGGVGEDAAVVRASSLRLWSTLGLAGEPTAEALLGLEETEAAGQAGGDAEEAGPGLRLRAFRPIRSTAWPPYPVRTGAPVRRWPEPGLSHSPRLPWPARPGVLVSSTHSDITKGDFGVGRIAQDQLWLGRRRQDLLPQTPEGGSFVFPNNLLFGVLVQFTDCLMRMSYRCYVAHPDNIVENTGKNKRKKEPGR